MSKINYKAYDRRLEYAPKGKLRLLCDDLDGSSNRGSYFEAEGVHIEDTDIFILTDENENRRYKVKGWMSCDDYERRKRDEAKEESRKSFAAKQLIGITLELARQFELNVFVVTDGASGTYNRGCEAVKNARKCHIEWEKQHGIDPTHNWDESDIR